MSYITKQIEWVETVFAPLPDANSTTIQILVKAGSIYEARETNGLSHFLEHMFFKWGKKYTTPKAVAETIDSFGGEFNAFTWNEYAWYYVKCAPEYSGKAMDVLGDMLVHSQFPKEEMEREKGVVIQEIAMYEDNPQRQVWTKQNERYYGDNSFGWPILGPASNVESFTQENLFQHKENLYAKDNLVVIVAWALPNQAELESQIAELFWALPEKKAGTTPSVPEYKPSTHEDHFVKDTQQNHLVIAAPWFSKHENERYAAKILGKILWWGMSSRLFQRIREQQGLCYYVGSTHSDGRNDGNFLIYAGMDKAKRDQWLSSIYKEIAGIAAGDITQEEFDMALGNIRWSTQMWIETSDQLADFVWYQWLFKKNIVSLEDILKEYEKVTLDQVNWLGTKLMKDSLWAYWLQ